MPITIGNVRDALEYLTRLSNANGIYDICNNIILFECTMKTYNIAEVGRKPVGS